MIGLLGVCFGYNMFLCNGLLFVKLVVIISIDFIVFIKIINFSIELVFVKRGLIMVYFKFIDNIFMIVFIDLG